MGNCIQQVSNNNKGGECAIKLRLYSDFTCPYCYLEFTRLRLAMANLPENQRLPLSHGPFQIDETLPAEGVDKYNFLSRLIPPEALDPMIDDLCQQFQVLGKEMNPRGMMGNSAPAHRLQIWAEENLSEPQATELKDCLFQIHCYEGKSMSDIDAIVKAAARAGLSDEKQVRDVINDKSYFTKLTKAKKHAKVKLGIDAVPALMVIQDCGKKKILEDASNIETVVGMQELVQKQCLLMTDDDIKVGRVSRRPSCCD